MRVPAVLPFALLFTLLASTVGGAATTHEVSVQDNLFDPHDVSGKVGDSVHWSRTLVGNPHNVQEDGQLFRSGAPSPGPIDFTVKFSAGKFHYFCEVHGSQAGGMDGLVKVKPKILAKPPGLPFTVRWASTSTETGSVFDVQYKVGTGKWKNWKKNVSGFKAVFGKNGKPVTVKKGKKYSLRARSQEGDIESLWSPKASFKP
ncbi:MAG: cupredoxin domain-containing protein [Actinomycetota bacterium]